MVVDVQTPAMASTDLGVEFYVKMKVLSPLFTCYDTIPAGRVTTYHCRHGWEGTPTFSYCFVSVERLLLLSKLFVFLVSPLLDLLETAEFCDGTVFFFWVCINCHFQVGSIL
jgi:hypothetical protein